MTHELEHPALLADVDALVGALRAWHDRATAWPPAAECRALLGRLLDRTEGLRVRIEAPLVVATLGGTGVGKSTLINALAGDEVSRAGRERPTTRLPTLVVRPGTKPEMFGIRSDAVRTVERDLPLLHDLVLVDCPDPDTTEDAEEKETNLARLRDLLPHCDVLLVVTTQQKYRSARVADELAAAAAGARLIFVQTHADVDDDVRDDWRRTLGDEFSPGEMFFLDAARAAADARSGRAATGEFARLLGFLTRQLAGTAAARIRRANLLDLIDQTLTLCRRRLAEPAAKLAALERAIDEQRAALGAQLVERVCGDLRANRRLWEERLLGAATERWGFSPFACLLRTYQALGTIVSAYGLTRARTPAQLALWGVWEGARRWQRRSRRRRGENPAAGVAESVWNDGDVRRAALIVDGYAAEAQLPRESIRSAAVAEQAAAAVRSFVERAAGELQSAVDVLARRRTGRSVRLCYEALLIVPAAALVYRFLKNFLYDSWLIEELGLGTARPQYGLEFFAAAAVTLVAWCGVLLWAFTARLKRGLNREIGAFAERMEGPPAAAGLFAPLDALRRRAAADVEALAVPAARTNELREQLATSERLLGHRR